jgi:hypothetical protein
MNKITTIFLSVFLTLGTIYLALLSWNAYKTHDYIGQTAEQKHSITITGEGKVTGSPDIAVVDLGYNIEKKTVAEAQADNTEKINSIISKLKNDFNIKPEDIKTTAYNIYPQYDWSNNKQTLRGYQVSQNVEAKIRDMNKIGDILDAAGQVGLNQIAGPNFQIDDPEKLKQEARELALKQAQTKAEALAKIAGVKLGKVISFSESGNSPLPIYSNYSMKADAVGLGGAAPAPTVEPGSTDITITATVEYEIL